MSEESPREAVTKLFELYADDVFRFALWMLGNRAEAEDVTQDAFLKALQSWHTFRGESSVKTWFWSIVKNTVIDQIRKRSRFRRWLVAFERSQSDVYSTRAYELSDLKIDLLSLPLLQRRVVLLRIVHELTSRETAEVLGWSESKVRTTLHRAVKTLRRDLSVADVETVGGKHS